MIDKGQDKRENRSRATEFGFFIKHTNGERKKKKDECPESPANKSAVIIECLTDANQRGTLGSLFSASHIPALTQWPKPTPSSFFVIHSSSHGAIAFKSSQRRDANWLRPGPTTRSESCNWGDRDQGSIVWGPTS